MAISLAKAVPRRLLKQGSLALLVVAQFFCALDLPGEIG